MALVVIRCPCGCVFRRDELSEKTCPSCGAVHDPGRSLAERLSPTTLRSLLVLSSSLLLGLFVILLALLLRKPPPPAAPPAAPAPPPLPVKVAETPRPPPEVVEAPLPELPAKPPPVEVLQGADVARAYRLVARANLGALVKTVLHYSDAREAAAHVAALLRAEHEELLEIFRRHPRQAELRSLPQRIEPDDRVLAFSTAGLDPGRPEPFVEEIRRWLRNYQPGAATLATLQRGANQVILPIYAPPLDDDFAALIRLSGVNAGSGGGGDALVRRPLPAALLAELQQRLDRLHPSHRDAIPAELADRAAEILRLGAGSQEDELFVRVRLLDLTIRPLEEEYASLRKKADDLEATTFDALLPDVLVFKSGRRLSVRLLEETAERVHVRLAVGEARFQPGDLASIERGQPAVAEFRAAFLRSRDSAPGLLALLPKVRDARFKPLRDLLCARLLVLDPANPTAWFELGFAPRLAGPPSRQQDVVHLKDGSRRSGRVVEEDAEAVVLEAPVLGARGGEIGAARVRVPRAELLRIDRMGDEARAEAAARAAAREEAGRRLEADLAALRLSRAQVQGLPGVSVLGSHFELLSTASERTTRETARTLEALFAAFQREFDARRNSGRRVEIHFFADRAQYDAAQKKTRGTVLPNPAYFSVKENRITAFDPVQSAEARGVREEIQRADQEVERRLRSLKEEEARLEEQLGSLRRSLAEKAAAKRRAGESAEAVEAWRERQAAQLRQSEQGLREQFAGYRREARRAIDQHQAAAVRCRETLAAQAEALRATLIHEAFHAFAANFLWADLDNEKLPRWLHEGFASYFESAAVDGGEVRHGAPHARHLALLRTTAKAGGLPPAASVLRAGPAVFAADHLGGGPDLPYAQAWLLAHWMASRGLDRGALDRYAQAAAAGGDPVDALENATGLAGAELDGALRTHLARLQGTGR